MNWEAQSGRPRGISSGARRALRLREKAHTRDGAAIAAAGEGKHLQAMLQAVQTIRLPLGDFYNSLSDEQKARFNNLGRQLFAQK